MSLTRFTAIMFLILALVGLPSQSLAAPLATGVIYADTLARSWGNWSWASVDLAAAAPVHSGLHSISVTYGAWDGLYLHYPEIYSSGYTALRFFIHGGSHGGQRVNLYLYLSVGGFEKGGPQVAIPQPQAGRWMQVDVPLSSLGATGASITGIVWQDATGSSQPVLYLDDIALVGDESPDGPILSGGELSRRAVPVGDFAGLVVRTRVSDPQGPADIISVSVDAGRIGLGSVPMHDDGLNADGDAGDGLWGAVLSIPSKIVPGEKSLVVYARDTAGHTSSLPLGSLVVLSPLGGSLPATLPQRIGWGSNAWDEDPGKDWQVTSGVPWDYVYQYITYDWFTDGWGGDFVARFVHRAWQNSFIPVVTVYMMLGVPPDCGESGKCYAQKLQNESTVKSYLVALEEAARQAGGKLPVIFNMEPDFHGYMQQYSNSSDRPAGVQPDDPGSIRVALNLPGYSNTLAGFGRRVVDLIHTVAPNALVAPKVSMWATGVDPHYTTSAEVVAIARRAAAFIDAMGGDRADMLVVEWSDRDAGSGLRPWWDDTDQDVPRPTRAILWENTLSAVSGKRLLLWQVPVGNMDQQNTCYHYQDNRAAYAFHHSRDLFEAGIVGVLFGGAGDCMTQVWTDGGFVASQGAIAYQLPPAPSGLEAIYVNGPNARIRWDHLSMPDLWKYRVTYSLRNGGTTFTRDTGTRNSMNLVMPFAGSWRIIVQAFDAMGRPGPASASLDFSISGGASFVFIPTLVR